MRVQRGGRRRAAFVPACLLLFTLACEREPGFLINIATQPDEVERIRVRTWLDGVQGQDSYLAKDQTRFAVRLPLDSTGMVHVDVAALDIMDCARAVGSLKEQVPANLSKFTERTLELTTLSMPLCVFGSSTTFMLPMGALQPYSVAAGDYNDDLILDLVTANYNTGDVSVLRGIGEGQFAPVGNVKVGKMPRSVAMGDFDGDLKLDLAVANSVDHTVSVLKGDGSGNFIPVVGSPIAVGTTPISVVIGNFDGDRWLDLAIANNGSGNVSVLMGMGACAFAAPVFTTVGSGPRSLAVGHFNGDMNLDLAVANAVSNNVSVLLGDGAGRFTGMAMNFPAGRSSYAVAVSDFNGDRKSDLVVANNLDNSVSVLLGNGSGGFDAATHFPVSVPSYVSPFPAPFSLAVGDFNGDMKSDVVVANSILNYVSVLLGNGQGRLGPASNFQVASTSYSVAVGYFDGDTRPDVAVANVETSNISILLNQF